MTDRFVSTGTMRAMPSSAIKLMIAVMFGAIVAVPVVVDMVASAEVDGVTETVLDLLPLFVGLLLIVALAGPIMKEMG